MVRLDIGCRTQRRDVIGIDHCDVPRTGIKADLNVGLPFKGDSADEIHAYHALEHAHDLVATMEEIWRVCKDGSLVFIRVPHASCPCVTWVEPSHRRGLTIETFASSATNERARFELDYARLHFVTGAARGRAVAALADYESLSCKLGRWLYPLLIRSRWMSSTERPYWVIPPDHAFKGHYHQIIRLGGRWLKLRNFSVSLVRLSPGWGSLVEKLPRSLAHRILSTADSIGRLAPAMSDVVVCTWSPRAEVKKRWLRSRARRQRRRTG